VSYLGNDTYPGMESGYPPGAALPESAQPNHGDRLPRDLAIMAGMAPDASGDIGSDAGGRDGASSNSRSLNQAAPPQTSTLDEISFLSDCPNDQSSIGDSIDVERIPAPEDTDELTRVTIAKMCEYIRDGARDNDGVGKAMQYATQVIGRGRTDPYSLAWAVFWFLKHRIKKVVDEASMFRLGEPDQADMLISPAVLIRMGRDAQEDCDGFTMLAAAMLAGTRRANVRIITIACDPRDRSRWSHVFLMVAMPGGRWLPLDCSHGSGPGWMVPLQHISRWQAWDLNGNPVDTPAMPAVHRSNLHGFVPVGRGMGDDSGDDSGDTGVDTTVSPIMVGPLAPNESYGPPPAGYTCPMDASGNCTAPATALSTASPFPTSTAASGSNALASIFSSLFSNAAKVASVAELPAGASLLPSGAVIGSGQTLPGSGNLLLIGGGILALVLIAMSFGGKK